MNDPPPQRMMTEVESNVGSGSTPKKSRKSKVPTPIYRTTSSPSSPKRLETRTEDSFSKEDSSGPMSDNRLSRPLGASSSPPTSSAAGMAALLGAAAAGAGIPGGVGSPSAPIRSYSDFMRTLAAKYNNNE